MFFTYLHFFPFNFCKALVENNNIYLEKHYLFGLISAFTFPNNDISLIRLSSPIVFSPTIRPVCLPTRNVGPGMLA
jgi:hypothetical protein